MKLNISEWYKRNNTISKTNNNFVNNKLNNW